MSKVILGLTGAVGSGKSTALALFEKAGATVADADGIVRRLLAEDKTVLRQVTRLLGREVAAGGKLDRAKMASRVFTRPRLRRGLERILHPRVGKEMRAVVRRSKGLVVLDIPLLFESKLEGMVDKIAVVAAPEKVRLKRLVKSGRMTAADARRRMRAQLPLAEKIRRADFVLKNDGPPGQLARQVKALIAQLK